MALIDVGVATVTLKPKTAIRLNGFATDSRKVEAAPVADQLFAKALAFGPDGDVAVLITVDNCAIPEQAYVDVADRLLTEAAIPRERLTICYSHSHMSPCLTGAIPGILNWPTWPPPTPAEIAHIKDYTQLVVDGLVEVAIDAIDDREPSTVEWAQGSVGFAANRHPRNDVYGRQGFPVDRDLPVLRVIDDGGDVQAVLVSYACHCTNSPDNIISGEWAGAAQRYIEQAYPGVTALVAIGCAADANPEPANLNAIDTEGQIIAAEVDRLFNQANWLPIDSPPACALKTLQLPRAGDAAVDYPIQTWRFGQDLAMVFFASEAVVDYAAALKTDYDEAPLWVNAYANTSKPGYIPSEWTVFEANHPPPNPGFWYNYEAFIANTDVYKLSGASYPDNLDTRIIDEVNAQLAGVPRVWDPVTRAEEVTAMTASNARLFAATARSSNRLFWRNAAAPPATGWTDIGEAQQVAGLAAWNGTLFCIAGGSLQHRLADTVVRVWQMIGAGPPQGNVTALTAIGGSLFAATDLNRLWTRPATTVPAVWTQVGGAEHLITMAASATHMFGVTYEGRLFRRAPVQIDVPWEAVGNARDVQALAVVGNELYRATRLNELLKRALPPIQT